MTTAEEVKFLKNNTILISIVLAVVVGAGGFFAGMQYQKNQRANFTGQAGRGGQFAGRTGAGGRNGMGATVGQIISQDQNSITVKMQDGSSKIILISGSTMINKAATATQSDLQIGTTVAVFGTTNSDGSVTASNVQINPINRFGMGARPSTNP